MALPWYDTPSRVGQVGRYRACRLGHRMVASAPRDPRAPTRMVQREFVFDHQICETVQRACSTLSRPEVLRVLSMPPVRACNHAVATLPLEGWFRSHRCLQVSPSCVPSGTTEPVARCSRSSHLASTRPDKVQKLSISLALPSRPYRKKQQRQWQQRSEMNGRSQTRAFTPAPAAHRHSLSRKTAKRAASQRLTLCRSTGSDGAHLPSLRCPVG
jgi:hypothetical protein